MSRFSIILGDYEERLLSEYIANRKGMKPNTGVNELVKLGLLKSSGKSQEDELRLIIREQIKIGTRPYTETLASMSSKLTYFIGRGLFLLVQVVMDGVVKVLNKESRGVIKELYDQAERIAIGNMKNPIKNDNDD